MPKTLTHPFQSAFRIFRASPVPFLGCAAVCLSALAGCLSDGGGSASPFEGQWKDREEDTFTLNDSLYRVELVRYVETRGYYVPFAGPRAGPDSGKAPAPDSLYDAFHAQYSCLRPDCDSLLWTRKYYFRITADTLKTYQIINGDLASYGAMKFRFDRDSTYITVYAMVEAASHYRFYSGGDSLLVEDGLRDLHLGRSQDPLPEP
jgi:hypothetical protein